MSIFSFRYTLSVALKLQYIKFGMLSGLRCGKSKWSKMDVINFESNKLLPSNIKIFEPIGITFDLWYPSTVLSLVLEFLLIDQYIFKKFDITDLTWTSH